MTAAAWADPVRAAQILAGLLSNALKYTQPAGWSASGPPTRRGPC
jgi:signal transduction histidine kinase